MREYIYYPLCQHSFLNPQSTPKNPTMYIPHHPHPSLLHMFPPNPTTGPLLTKTTIPDRPCADCILEPLSAEAVSKRARYFAAVEILQIPVPGEEKRRTEAKGKVLGMLLVQHLEAEAAFEGMREELRGAGRLHEGWSRRRNTADLKEPEVEGEDLVLGKESMPEKEAKELMPEKKARELMPANHGPGIGSGVEREEGRLGFDVE